jgi:hypothetical protein
MIVFLDSNILGLICSTNTLFEEAEQCKKWFYGSVVRGIRFITSDLCDYEVKRGLISSAMRNNRSAPGLSLLDALKTDGFVEFRSVSTADFHLAANLWAIASTQGNTTRDEKNIDVDIILSAQYQLIRDENPGRSVIMATTNLKHLSLFCDAAHWRDIKF